MAPIVAGLVLAAGAARRLRPISLQVAKPLCPVLDRTLLDHALGRLAEVGADPAVNVHHHAAAIVDAVGDRAMVSHEVHEPLGTAGAIGLIRPWIDGRDLLVVNADTWSPGGTPALLDGWRGDRVRVLVPGGAPFGPTARIAGCVLPAHIVDRLSATPAGLYEVVWREEAAAGRLDVIAFDGPFHDCGTPRRLLEANLAALGGSNDTENHIDSTALVLGRAHASVVGSKAIVAGDIDETVVFAGAEVARGEVLRRAIRLRTPDGPMTVLVRDGAC